MTKNIKNRHHLGERSFIIGIFPSCSSPSTVHSTPSDGFPNLPSTRRLYVYRTRQRDKVLHIVLILIETTSY